MGMVYFALWNESTEVAIKRIIAPADFLDALTLQEFQTEISTLRQLRHPHIVQYMGASRSPEGDIYLVTEYIPNGSLADKLEEQQDLPVPTIFTILTGVAAGMSYLHSRHPPLIHRDLKPQNLLVVGDFVSVKIADFGSSLLMTNDSLKNLTTAGTVEVSSILIAITSHLKVL
eukprot:TRINITY_DN1644_c0_g1_i10.p1 TRINITY_DN1644_c0_g1~~TRINITY_DN1644_c0_g1_i10.p1  ORF type:complete len:173 (+),score=18.36 TRINITY_DN1644_c0_g1_i10:336-854(+)